jgi:hypothetical protein
MTEFGRGSSPGPYRSAALPTGTLAKHSTGLSAGLPTAHPTCITFELCNLLGQEVVVDVDENCTVQNLFALAFEPLRTSVYNNPRNCRLVRIEAQKKYKKNLIL